MSKDLVDDWIDYFLYRTSAKNIPGEAGVLSNEAAMALQWIAD